MTTLWFRSQCRRRFSLSPFLPIGRSRPSATGYGEGRGEGTLRESAPCGEPPHPDLLPAGGEKEKKTLAWGEGAGTAAPCAIALRLAGALACIALAVALAAAARAAETPAPQPCTNCANQTLPSADIVPDLPANVPPNDPAVQAHLPGCAVWTDRCVTCQRDAGKITCSNIGIACQPQAVECVRAEPVEEKK
jgi:hypothetical protein